MFVECMRTLPERGLRSRNVRGVPRSVSSRTDAREFDSGAREFDSGEREFDSAEREFDSGEREFDSGEREFESRERELHSGYVNYTPGT